MIEIDKKRYKIEEIKDIKEIENYKDIETIKIISCYKKIELPKELDKLKKLYIEDYKDEIKIPKYKNLKELYLEDIKNDKIYELPKFNNLEKLIIKCCKGIIIPEYKKLRYLYIEKYIIDDNNKYKINRKYKNLICCKLKDIKKIKEINLESSKIKLFINENKKLKVNIKNKENYYKEINNKNIKKIINELFDENMEFINKFEERFNKIIEKHRDYGEFKEEYLNIIFKELFKEYPEYLKYENIDIFKRIIYENIDENIKNQKFNENILGFKEYYIAYKSFINNYTITLSCYNFNNINEIKKDILDFINITNTKYSLNDNNIIKTKRIRLN